MGKFVCLLLLGLIAAASTTDSMPPEPPKDVTTTTTTTTTTPATTTAIPTTTTSKPTTPPTTTTTTTTTPAPTTTTPTTTTTPPPPTTPAPPAPKPVEPETGTWRVNLTNPSNISCIVAKMSLQIEVPYKTKDNKTQKAYVNVPKNATVAGSCLEKVQNIELKWDKNWVQFVFKKEKEDYGVGMLEAFIVADPKNFPSILNETTTILAMYNTSFFNISNTKSFKCDKLQTLDMTAKNVTVAQIHLNHLQMQAFLTNTTQTFSDAVDCSPFSTPDIVPIAAGCTLAALIIVVLVGYLVGRRRSQARGYLSM